jgi:hypothetical protein
MIWKCLKTRIMLYIRGLDGKVEKDTIQIITYIF